MTRRIAMWSGPRNLSTAMMYSFAARGDCAVSDEPFYAAYLALTGLNHPMRDEILTSQPTDPKAVGVSLAQDRTEAIWYQKHMTRHMIDGIPRDWMHEVSHVFLIRHPARVIASYARKRERPTLEDLGFPQQKSLFDEVAGEGALVVDSSDIRAAPDTMLETMCSRLHIPYTDRMLSWSAGGHKEDGVWAAHWYDAVHRSTGFDGAEGPLPELPDEYRPLLEEALPIYREFRERRLTLEGA